MTKWINKCDSFLVPEFCTPWPAGLETVTKQEKHFPVTTSKSSYLHSSPTIRDDKARIVTLKVCGLDYASSQRDCQS